MTCFTLGQLIMLISFALSMNHNSLASLCTNQKFSVEWGGVEESGPQANLVSTRTALDSNRNYKLCTLNCLHFSYKHWCCAHCIYTTELLLKFINLKVNITSTSRVDRSQDTEGACFAIFGSNLGGALYLWICLSIRLCLSIYLSETEFLNSDFTSQYLSNCSSDWAEIWHTYQP